MVWKGKIATQNPSQSTPTHRHGTRSSQSRPTLRVRSQPHRRGHISLPTGSRIAAILPIPVIQRIPQPLLLRAGLQPREGRERDPGHGGFARSRSQRRAQQNPAVWGCLSSFLFFSFCMFISLWRSSLRQLRAVEHLTRAPSCHGEDDLRGAARHKPLSSSV